MKMEAKAMTVKQALKECKAYAKDKLRKIQEEVDYWPDGSTTRNCWIFFHSLGSCIGEDSWEKAIARMKEIYSQEFLGVAEGTAPDGGGKGGRRKSLKTKG